jgi:hypothetical protein
MASNLFVKVAKAAAFRLYLAAFVCFVATVFFVLLCAVFAVEGLAALAALFTLDPVFALAFTRVLVLARVLLART